MTPEYMDAEEFVDEGYLQELNRQFLHPLGLALEVGIDEYGWHLRGIWDYRDDPEGINYFDGILDIDKADNVQREFDRHAAARLRGLGYIIQPVKDES